MAGEFAHIPLQLILHGKPILGGHGQLSPQTYENRRNRVAHGNMLKQRVREISHIWLERSRSIVGTQSNIVVGVPFLLEIDPQSNMEFLRGLGLDIIAEVDDGFILVATKGFNLNLFNQRLDNFINRVNDRCNSPAQIYAMCQEPDRLKRVLSNELYDRWGILEDEALYCFDISVSCSSDIVMPNMPVKELGEENSHYEIRLERWKRKCTEKYMEWDELKEKRERDITNFIEIYEGEVQDNIDGIAEVSTLPDSFSLRITVKGKCIRDLVYNCAYLFEVDFGKEITIESTPNSEIPYDHRVKFKAPPDDAPSVCIIDSGVQENHYYLAQAVQRDLSISLIPNDTDTSDFVDYGGHGTRIAGAVLFSDSIPKEGTYEIKYWLRNIRVLGRNNKIPMAIEPPKLLSYIVKHNKETEKPSKIFNHSIGSRESCNLHYMSEWAATIDELSYDNDILFIQSAGNILDETIKAYYALGKQYPEYLYSRWSRICNPAQSLQALTVGSVSLSDYETPDEVALGSKNEPSAFSRSGPGIWDVIKPEVSEYGGTNVINKHGGEVILSTPPSVCPELIRRSPEGPAYSRDTVGTSFSTPFVTHIAAELERILPDSPSLLYRALIVQSAQWPSWVNNGDIELLKRAISSIGYGIPDIEKATENNEYRVTLITETIHELGESEAHVYKVPIPEELSQIGEDFDIQIEVTLSYAAKPRRTRRNMEGYLSTWLDWRCSRIGEDSRLFARRIFVEGRSLVNEGDFRWKIGESRNRGEANGFARKMGTVQKDWAIIKSNELRDDFCIAVRGHKGWGSLFKAKYVLVVSFEAINRDIPIYHSIRNLVETQVETQELELELDNF